MKGAVDNIERYYKGETSLCERMSANYGEIASFVANAALKDIKSRDFFLEDSPLSPYMPETNSSGGLSEVLAENERLCKVKLSVDKCAHIADFCAKVTASLKSQAKFKPSPTLFKTGASVKARSGKVAFAESRILATAFAEIQKREPGLSASYVRSFADACEEVSTSECEFCILPIENSREGSLLTVYKLIEKYDLFISRVCTIENDELTTKFALLCRENHDIIESNGKQYIDIRLSGNAPCLFTNVHTGAAVLGVETVKSLSIPLGYTDGYAHIFTFHADGDALFSLLLFLSTIRADYTLMGIYE